MDKILEGIKGKFNITNIKIQRDNLYFCSINKDMAVELVTYLRNNCGFTHLVLLTAVDYLEKGVFQLTYLLNNPESRTDLGVRVEIERENSAMESIHLLWEQAATYQRELKEMYGIDFPGSPRVDQEFILEGWEGMPPYRRDFDTEKYSEETYFPRHGRETKDPKAHMANKLYPGEEE